MSAKRTKNYGSGNDFIPSKEEIRFFMSKVRKTTTCWEWKRGVNTQGYGQFWLRDRNIPAHRFSYFIYNGELIHGLTIHHICNNRICVNPKHLRQVTKRENTLDKNSKAITAINKNKVCCKRGHKYTKESKYIRPDGKKWRDCKICRDLLSKNRNREKKIV